MVLYPFCKINIGLAIVRRRADGYHDLDTLFYPVRGLCDRLEIERSDAFSFAQDGLEVEGPTDTNLVVRCYRRMQQLYGIGPVRIRLTKRIPMGAGLGGGSADAAFTAMGLNELFALHLDREQLVDVVRPLGADCPYFVYGTPCRATGIGDILTPVDYTELRGKRLILIKPDVHVSTREAYAGVTPREAMPEAERLCSMRVNDFERSVFAAHPELARIKQTLVNLGAEYAAMSGSGSTIYGVFDPSLPIELPADLARDVVYDEVEQ